MGICNTIKNDGTIYQIIILFFIPIRELVTLCIKVKFGKVSEALYLAVTELLRSKVKKETQKSFRGYISETFDNRGLTRQAFSRIDSVLM